MFGKRGAPYDVHLKSKFGRWRNGGWFFDDVTSPCIDAGDPASDYALEPAGNGGRINLGRYGNTPRGFADHGRAVGRVLLIVR